MPRGKHNEARCQISRQELAALEAAGIKASLLREVLQGTAIPVNKARVFSRCAVPRIPEFWRDMRTRKATARKLHLEGLERKRRAASKAA